MATFLEEFKETKNLALFVECITEAQDGLVGLYASKKPYTAINDIIASLEMALYRMKKEGNADFWDEQKEKPKEFKICIKSCINFVAHENSDEIATCAVDRIKVVCGAICRYEVNI